MSSRLIFLERPEHTRKALKLIKSEGNSHVVALGANVMWALKRADQPFRIPYDYYDVGELRALNEELYKRTEDICDYLDRFLMEDIGYFGQNGFAPGHALFHPIKAALNTICHRMINIRAVLESERPSEVILYHDKKAVGRTYRFFQKFSHIYLTLIDLVTKNLGIGLKVFYDDKHLRLSRYKIEHAANIRLGKIYSALKSGKNAIKLLGKSDYKKGRGGPIPRYNNAFTLMVLKNSYSIQALGRYAREKRLGQIFDLNQFSVPKAPNGASVLDADIERLWSKLCDDKDFISLFCFDDICLLHDFKKVFFGILQNGLTDAVQAHNKTRQALEKEMVSSLLLPTISYPDEWGCAQACREKSIPVLVWQHGSYAMFDPHTQPVYCDIKNADYFLCFGDGVKRAYEEKAKECGTKIIPVGSSALDAIRGNEGLAKSNVRRNAGLRTVLMPLRGIDVSYLGDSYQVYPPDMYWREISEMLMMFKNLPGMKFILKLYPANSVFDNPLYEFIRANKIRNVALKKQPGFVQFLQDAELVIIDWPYTTLLESSRTRLPIICYEKRWPLRNGVEELIAKRCYVTKDIGTLQQFLEEFSKGELAPLENDELLCQYGNAKNDGKSSERAVEFLADIYSD
jgi:hypothetical protein